MPIGCARRGFCLRRLLAAFAADLLRNNTHGNHARNNDCRCRYALAKRSKSHAKAPPARYSSESPPELFIAAIGILIAAAATLPVNSIFVAVWTSIYPQCAWLLFPHRWAVRRPFRRLVPPLPE